MKIGGQILWNVTPICETFKISYLMGRRHTNGVLENHLKEPIVPFGSLVEYYPANLLQSGLHENGRRFPT